MPGIKGPATLGVAQLVARCDNAGLASLLFGRQRLEEPKFKVCLGYRVSSRPVWTTLTQNER